MIFNKTSGHFYCFKFYETIKNRTTITIQLNWKNFRDDANKHRKLIEKDQINSIAVRGALRLCICSVLLLYFSCFRAPFCLLTATDLMMSQQYPNIFHFSVHINSLRRCEVDFQCLPNYVNFFFFFFSAFFNSSFPLCLIYNYVAVCLHSLVCVCVVITSL